MNKSYKKKLHVYLIGDWKKVTVSVKVHTYIGISYLSHLYIYEYFYECFLYELNGFNHEVRFHLEKKAISICADFI